MKSFELACAVSGLVVLEESGNRPELQDRIRSFNRKEKDQIRAALIRLLADVQVEIG